MKARVRHELGWLTRRLGLLSGIALGVGMARVWGDGSWSWTGLSWVLLGIALPALLAVVDYLAEHARDRKSERAARREDVQAALSILDEGYEVAQLNDWGELTGTQLANRYYLIGERVIDICRATLGD